MNRISLIGRLSKLPDYHCTTQGRDLLRFQLSVPTPADNGLPRPVNHECECWGPAALSLHEHLRPDSRLLVRGALDYRSSGRPFVRVHGYTYLE